MSERSSCLASCCGFFLFFVFYPMLIGLSGGMMRLGAILLKQTNHRGYELYASHTGFKIGAVSAAIWQWLSAAFMSFYFAVVLSVHETHETASDILVQNSVFFLLPSLLLVLLNYEALPMAEKIVLSCHTLMRNKEDINPLCKTENSKLLYSAFYTGYGAAMVPLLSIFILITCLQVCCLRRARHVAAEVGRTSENEMDPMPNITREENDTTDTPAAREPFAVSNAI